MKLYIIVSYIFIVEATCLGLNNLTHYYIWSCCCRVGTQLFFFFYVSFPFWLHCEFGFDTPAVP